MTAVVATPVRGAPTLQQAYDAAPAPAQIIPNAAQPVTFRATADPNDVFAVERSGAENIFLVSSLGGSGHSLTIGPAGNRSLFLTEPATNSNPTTIQVIPDGRTKTVLNALDNAAVLAWTSTFVSNIPAGGGIGNDSGFGMVFAAGTLELLDQGNLFSTSIVFNQATRVECNGANSGPVYTMVNQPRVVNTAAGARTMSQANAVRSQMRVESGPGNMTLTSHEPYFAVLTLDSSTGAGVAAATTVNYFAPKAPGFVGVGGSIVTLNCMDIPDIPIAGITNLRGINSAMDDGSFIRHVGVAPSQLGGSLSFFDGAGSEGIELDRPGAGVLRMSGVGGAFNEQLDWDFQNSNNVAITSPSSAGLNFDLTEIAFGPSTTADGTNNWVFAFSPGLRATQLAGEYSEVLFTSAAAISVAHAISRFSTWTINFPTVVLGAGSVTDASVVTIQTNPNVGSVNRTGLVILTNPSGGSGVNAALWITAGLSRFDGRVDINNGIALGGGAAATLGTIGGSGPTAAAQAQWVEIDIGGTAHWIPVWT